MNRIPVGARFPIDEFDQLDPMGCWAASLQMVLANQDITLSQQEIVQTAKGIVPEPGSLEYAGDAGDIRRVLQALNQLGAVRNPKFIVSLAPPGPFNKGIAASELQKGNPVIALLPPGAGQTAGHAVVLYEGLAASGASGLVLVTGTHFDPSPSVKGPQSSELDQFVGMWNVEVQMADRVDPEDEPPKYPVYQ